MSFNNISINSWRWRKTGHFFICVSILDLMEIRIQEQHLCPLWQVFWVVGKAFEKEFHIEAEREMDSNRKTYTACQGKLQQNQSHSVLNSGLTAPMMDWSLGECSPPSGKTPGGHIHLWSLLRSLISFRLWHHFLECAAWDGLAAQFMDLCLNTWAWAGLSGKQFGNLVDEGSGWQQVPFVAFTACCHDKDSACFINVFQCHGEGHLNTDGEPSLWRPLTHTVSGLGGGSAQTLRTSVLWGLFGVREEEASRKWISRGFMENIVWIYFSRCCLDIFVHTHSCRRCALMSTNDNAVCAMQVTKEFVIFPRSEDRPNGVLPWNVRADSSLWSLYLEPRDATCHRGWLPGPLAALLSEGVWILCAFQNGKCGWKTLYWL